MRSISFKLAISLLFLAIASAPQAASACFTRAPFHIEDVTRADAVFSGRLIRYQLVSPGRPDSLDEYALLTVRVDKVLKGRVPRDVQLYWWNSTFGVPKTMVRPEPILIAANSATARGLPLRGPSATVFASRRPDLLQVMQAPCSNAFILPWSPQGEANIRTLLGGGKVGPYDYFATGRKERR
jgi:hypothetical protein